MAKTKNTSKSLSIVNTEANVYLTVTIGNAQIGGTLVRWKDSATNLGKGKITNLNLGTGNQVKGQILELFTNIIDVNPATNGVVATYHFQNCDPSTFILSDSVDNQGDIFSFVTAVTFE